jgi:Eukaryotic aspartyl protease.
MLIFVYLLSQVFIQAAAAFEPISFDFNRVEDSRIVKRDEVSNGFESDYRGDITKRDFVDVNIWSMPFIYVISLGVGSNKEAMKVYFDFSSSDLTLLSSDTLSNPDSSKGTFNYSQSTTFKQNETFYSQNLYPGGNGTGFWGQDDVTIGNVTVKGLDFGVQNVSSLPFGTLGLGLPEWESTYENASAPYIYENMPMKLKSQGVISKVAYSVYHRPSAYYNANNGSLLFGAVDHAKYSGNLTTLPMIKYNSTGVTIASNISTDNFITERQIQVLLHGIKFSVNTDKKGKTMTITNNTYYAAINPSFDTSYFPKPIVEAMAVALGAQFLTEYDNWIVPCVNDENVVFLLDFGGITLRVPLSSLFFRYDTLCVLGVSTLPEQEDFILLGHNILKHAYLVFDLEDREVSIAQVELSKKSDIQEIVSLVPSAVKGSTQTTIGNITSEEKQPHLFTYKTMAASDVPYFTRTSESKAISLTWIMVLFGFASLITII